MTLVSSVRVVPETKLMSGEQLSADDAWHTVRRYGLGHLLATGFLRFRYGDGFSHARAFGLQLALATVPLIIAGAGLSAALGAESFAEVVARTVVAISPGSSDALVADVVEDGSEHGSDQGQLVVVLGLATAFVAATSAFAQLERGANRIYGTDRDRPALRKYARAAVLTLTAGSALALGLLLIVAGEPFGDAVEQVYHWGDAAESVFDVVRWPLGLAALVLRGDGAVPARPAAAAAGAVVARGRGHGDGAGLAGGLGPAGALRRECGQLRRHLRPAHRRDGAAALGERHGRRAAGRGRARGATRSGAGGRVGPAADRQRQRRHPGPPRRAAGSPAR